MKYVRKHPVIYDAWLWEGQEQDKWPDFLLIPHGAQFFSDRLQIWDSKVRAWIDVDRGDYVLSDGKSSSVISRRELEKDFKIYDGYKSNKKEWDFE